MQLENPERLAARPDIPNAASTSCYTWRRMDLFRFDPPGLTDDEIRAIAAERYGLTGVIQPLRGERSHNTLIRTDQGDCFVLKIASPSEPLPTIDFHASALAHLERRAPELPVARMIRSVDGELVPVLERSDGRHGMRLVTFLPGCTFRDDQIISLGGLSRIGALVGAMSVALADFSHPAEDEFMPWDIANGLMIDDDLWLGLQPDARAILTPARSTLEHALEVLAQLPHQVIHNDAHAGNLLRTDPASDVVTGVIDFGDVVRTATVADLGVSGANLVPHQPDPIAAVVALVTGFHRARPLSSAEVHAVPLLVLARLALSILLTEHQIASAPHIADDVAAERPRLLANLERWLSLDTGRIRIALEEALA